MGSFKNSLTVARAAVVAGLLVTSAACSATPPSAPTERQTTHGAAEPATTSSHVDAEVVRGGVHYDFEAAASVREAAATADLVALGTITQWLDGRQVLDGDELLKSAVLEVRVDRRFTPRDQPESVFVEVQRGGTLVDEHGRDIELPDGSTFEQRTVEALREAAPAGIRVLILAQRAPADDHIEDEAGQKVVKPWEHPDGKGELFAAIPQGLLFEDAEGGYVSGVADQEAVELGSWPAAAAPERRDHFQQLIDELSIDELTEEFGPRSR